MQVKEKRAEVNIIKLTCVRMACEGAFDATNTEDATRRWQAKVPKRRDLMVKSESIYFIVLDKITLHASTPPKPDLSDKEQGGKLGPTSLQKDGSSLNSYRSSGGGKSVLDASEKKWDGSQKTNDIQLLSYSEWEKGGLDGEDVQITMTSETKDKANPLAIILSAAMILKYRLREVRRLRG
ncbi:hypothetical protein Tco_1401185 [Tanacetum coccineum]